MEVDGTQDRVQWQALLLAVFNIRVPLTESQLLNLLNDIRYEDWRWIELI